MRVAVLADIHGNLVALDAVLADLEAQGGADAIVIAGDLCLDGPRPRETIERLRGLGHPIVQGNTDRDLADPTGEQTGEDWHAALFDWTRQQLGPDEFDFLRGLPFSHRIAGPDGGGAILVVHANPKNLDDHLRPNAPEAQIAPLLDEVAPEVTTIVFGHLHIPYERQIGRLQLVDVSSVGLPKDGDRRANYGLLMWADGAWSVEQRRVEYPVEEVVAQWREADAPGADEAIKVLLRARYPNMTAARGGRAPARRATATRPAPAASAPDVDAERRTLDLAETAPEPPSAPVGDAPATPDQEAAFQPAPADDVPEDLGLAEATGAATPMATSDAGEPDSAPPERAMPPDAPDDALGVAQVDARSGEEIEPVPATVPATVPAAEGADQVLSVSAATAATLDTLAAEVEGLLTDLDTAALTATEEASPEERAQLTAAMDELDALIEEMDAALSGEEMADEDEDGDEDERDDAKPKAGGAGRKGKKKARKAAKRAAKEREAVAMDADDPFAAVIPAILTARLDTALAQLAGVRADEDIEAVHDMRVATRRLRAALDAAEPFYGGKEFRRATRRVRALARALGRVRDADVLLEFLHARAAEVPDDERAGIEGLMDAISADRADARDDLDPVLDRWGDEADSHAAEFRRFVGKTKGRKGRVRERDLTGAVAARALDARLDEFDDRAEVFDEEGADAEAFHDLRIAAKGLRYTIELFAPVLGEEAEELLDELKSLQETLGTMHDRDVLVDLLAWERARALERQLHMLEYTTFNPGTREDRLGAVREQLAGPDSFAGTAIGIYGLLIDIADERDGLEEQLRARWAELDGLGFSERLRALAGDLLDGGAHREPVFAPVAAWVDEDGEDDEDDE